MVIIFVNRKGELEFLEGEYKRAGSSLIIIYGRRRVGKTELIKQFIRDKEHIYFLASREPTAIQLQRLLARVAHHYNKRPPRIDDWLEGIKYIGENLREQSIILALDEFPYLVGSNKAIPSYFQHLADEYLKGSGSMLILSGSSVGIMESEVLGQKSPLYGRRTGQIDLAPFDFENSRLLIRKGIKDCVEAYAVFGNTPMYLNFFDPGKSLPDNILTAVLNKNAFLYKEPELILKQELREPAVYMSILGAIARGPTSLGSISGATKIQPGALPKYLDKLVGLRLIKREVAVTRRGKKSRKSLYSVRDGLFRFWFRFVEPNLSDVETNPEKFLTSTIVPELPGFVAGTFEEVCREFVRKRLDYGSVGRWWHKGEEIDIVALNKQKNQILFAECKWKSNVSPAKLLEQLKEKSALVEWHAGRRKEEFALFAKSFRKKPQVDGVYCFDLNDLDRALKP